MQSYSPSNMLRFVALNAKLQSVKHVALCCIECKVTVCQTCCSPSNMFFVFLGHPVEAELKVILTPINLNWSFAEYLRGSTKLWSDYFRLWSDNSVFPTYSIWKTTMRQKVCAKPNNHWFDFCNIHHDLKEAHDNLDNVSSPPTVYGL